MSNPENGNGHEPLWKVLLSNQQFTSAIRTLILVLCSSIATWVVARGLASEADVQLAKVLYEAAAPAIGIALTIIWSQMTRTKKAIIAQAAKLPEVTTVVVKDDATGGAEAAVKDGSLPNVVSESAMETKT